MPNTTYTIQQMQNHGITFLYGPENLGVKDSLTLLIFPNCKLKGETLGIESGTQLKKG